MIPRLQLQANNNNEAYLTLSKFWLGTWALSGFRYGKTPRDEAIKTIQSALDIGINAFDTSPFYGQGYSDSLIYPFRSNNDLFISTKVGLRWEGNTVVHAAAPAQLREDALRIIQTHKLDAIDLLLLHWPDPNIPLSDSLDTLDSLYKEGICKRWGVCNISETQTLTLDSYSYQAIQQRSSLFHESIITREHTALSIGYSPLEQGLLVSPNKIDKLGKKDVRNRNPYFKSESHSNWLNTYFSLCNDVDIHPGILAFLWPFYRDGITVSLFGARSPQQLDLLSSTLSFCETVGLSFSDQRNWATLLSSRCDRLLWEHLQRVPDSLSFT